MADRRISCGCICIYQSAEWALVKGLTGTDLVVVQVLNDHQSVAGQLEYSVSEVNRHCFSVSFSPCSTVLQRKRGAI